MQTPLTKSLTVLHTSTGGSLGGVCLEGVEVLTGLGLSGRQARVYLALLKAGNAKVQTVAGPSLVHRQEIYRILDDLMQMGLVQRNLSTPITYAPTPIDEAVKVLLQQKTNKLNHISEQAKLLTDKLSRSGTTHTMINLKPCFGTVFEADRGRTYYKNIKNTCISIDAVTSWKRFKQLSTHYETQLLTDLKKGITIQITTEKPPSIHMPKWVKTATSKYPNFIIKTILNTPRVGVTIFDYNKAAIAYDPNVSIAKGPELWTNNPAMLALCQTYFNSMWT